MPATLCYSCWSMKLAKKGKLIGKLCSYDRCCRQAEDDHFEAETMMLLKIVDYASFAEILLH